ncbi:shikimate dehydrogenase [Nitratireductor sp. CAU 1489]|uniref:Shikimate dehydrogenase n=2 Tax=Nitratireductor arenosus TaxID=2682096 RepID=A0A844QN34_9HYPH|nr:shikimate dehydrogenase [Nitratireductor arenosus]
MFAPGAGALLTMMIGSPIAHAHLPAVFNRRFLRARLDALMAPVDLAAEALPAFFLSMRGWANCRGAVVTAPHKQACLTHVDRASLEAGLLGAVNVVTRHDDGTLEGDNVDGAGFLRAARAGGFDPDGASALVFGCGGAGSAIALALARAGLDRVRLVDTDTARAAALARLIEANSATRAETGPPDMLAPYNLVVNATAIGYDGQQTVFPLDTVAAGSLVADVLARPEKTAWLREAEGRGCTIQDGAAMAEAQFGLIARRFGLFGDKEEPV